MTTPSKAQGDQKYMLHHCLYFLIRFSNSMLSAEQSITVMLEFVDPDEPFG
jgi:hypothetical protein